VSTLRGWLRFALLCVCDELGLCTNRSLSFLNSLLCYDVTFFFIDPFRFILQNPVNEYCVTSAVERVWLNSYSTSSDYGLETV
jgi:hypothetical protein